jgi:hypothetical protein
MFEFELDNSSYFDFSTEKNRDFVIKQNTDLPILEIKPIRTENYQELLELIQNCTITFSMFDLNNKYIILNDEALINLETLSNRILNDEDNCRELMDFTIQYKFKKKNTAKAGFYVGEFKIVFIKDGEEKTLIVPINNKLNILITPSTNC